MKQWVSKTLQLCGITALLLLPTAKAEAVIASVKALGLAGTSVAFPQDSITAAYNPAAGIDVGNRVDLGLTWVQQNGKTTISGNIFPVSGINGVHHSSRGRNSFSPEFGINYMVCDSADFSIGLVGYNKGYIQTSYGAPIPIIGTSKPGLEAIQEVIAPTAALRFNCHTFGVALQIAGQRFKAHGLQRFDTFVFSSSPGHVTNRGADLSYGVGVVVGYLWHAYPGVKIGLTYEPKTRMGRLKKYRGFLENGGRLDLPERYAAGISFEVAQGFNVALDYEYRRWSRIGSLGNQAPTTLAQLANNKLGNNHGPGFSWRDQPVVRGGIDYAIPCFDLVVRAGYRWQRTPIRSNATFVNALTLDNFENFATFGLTWTPWCGTEISAFYGHAFDHTIRDSKGLDSFLGGGTADLTNSVNTVGISWGFYY